MKHYYKLLLASALLILASAFAANAIPAKLQSYTATQPDGTKVFLKIQGDEFFHLTTAQDGCAVALGSDGYVRYANFVNGVQIVTEYIYGDKNTPAEVISNSRNIPVAEMKQIAHERRAQFGESMAKQLELRKIATRDGGKRTIMCPVIIVDFPDLRLSKGTQQKFDNLLNEEGYASDGATGSASDYFKAQFGEMYDFHFDVLQPYTAKNNHAHYGSGDTGIGASELVAETCMVLDESVDFSKYDMDGDGNIDFVFMFFAGPDEAQGGGEECIWSHAWDVSYNPSYRNVMLDGKKLATYACTSEIRGSSVEYGKFAAIGTFCHEFSHIMGLADAYDTDYEGSGGNSDCLWGVTSIMDGGGYSNESNTPPFYNCFEREMTDIATAIPAEEKNFTLKPIHEANEFVKIETDKTNEYFLIEYRKQEEWDQFLPTSGVLIYHIDKSTNIAGQAMTAAMRWTRNTVNAYPPHQCADLIEAASRILSKSDIFFPGRYQVTECSTSTHNDDFVCWSGSPVGFAITDIALDSEKATASFNLKKSDASDYPSVSKHTIKVIGKDALLTWTPTKEMEGAVATVELWRTDNGRLSGTFTGQNNSVLFEGLSAEEYEVTIQYSVENVVGKEYSFKFKTNNTTVPFPFIFIDREQLKKGQNITLRLGNSPKGATVKWFLDGSELSIPENLSLSAEGEKELKAQITYSDGTVENTSMTINVK